MASEGTEYLTTYPFSEAPAARDGDLIVIRQDMGFLCGYCALPVADLPDGWAGTYDAPGMQFLAVHGGMTYAAVKGDRAVYGFDCGHAGDDERDELSDPDHVLGLARQMHDQLLALAARYTEFTAADRQGKSDILDSIREGAAPVEWGFGAMIEMMAGAPSLDQVQS